MLNKVDIYVWEWLLKYWNLWNYKLDDDIFEMIIIKCIMVDS